MQPLSATECISPALERTKDLLARPFRAGTYLKLTALAFFAELGTGSCNIGNPARTHGAHGLPPGLIAFFVAFALVLMLIGIAVWLVMLYVSSRLQLVLVELVATRQQYVSPFWRRQSSTTWRWVGLKLAYMLGVVVIAAALGAPFAIYAIRHRIFAGSAGPPLGWMFAVIPLALLVGIVAAGFYSVLRGLAMPSMALEGAPAAEAIRRARAIVDAEPGQVLLFVVLQMLLTIAMVIAAEILIALVALISLIPLGLVGGGAWLALRHSGGADTALLIALAIAGGIIFVVWMALVIIGLLGPVQVFMQAYSLYFLGGRYPLLGDLLDQTTPFPGFYAPPGFVPPPIAPPEPGLSI
jgi:hypothetical protein